MHALIYCGCTSPCVGCGRGGGGWSWVVADEVCIVRHQLPLSANFNLLELLLLVVQVEELLLSVAQCCATLTAVCVSKVFTSTVCVCACNVPVFVRVLHVCV